MASVDAEATAEGAEGRTEMTLTTSLLEASLAAARKRIAELEDRRESLLAELESVGREADLLQQLIDARRGTSSARPVVGPSVQERQTLTVRRTRTHPVVTEAIAELDREKRPLHISELMQALRDRGVEIPGQGEPANLIAHLTKDERIVRPSRGMYALALWGLEVKPKLKPARRPRVRGRSKTEMKGN